MSRHLEMRYRLTPWRPIQLHDLIRLGRDFDGGYVVSAAGIDAADVLVGMGINDDWSFEADFARRRPGRPIVAIDGSVSSETFRLRCRAAAGRAVPALRGADWRALQGALREALWWWKSARRFDDFFGAPRRAFVQRYLGRADLAWPDLARAMIPPDARLFVKMDIEGAEYDLLPDIAADHGRIVGFAIEFHDCGERWTDFATAMEMLRPQFAVAHMHGNNCAPLVPGTMLPSVLEVSLVRRDLVPRPVRPSDAHALPLESLDMPNRPDRDDYVLSF